MGQGVLLFEGLFLLLNYGFQYLNLNKIIGEVLPENTRAVRLNEAIGMRLEDAARPSLLRWGLPQLFGSPCSVVISTRTPQLVRQFHISPRHRTPDHACWSDDRANLGTLDYSSGRVFQEPPCTRRRLHSGKVLEQRDERRRHAGLSTTKDRVLERTDLFQRRERCGCRRPRCRRLRIPIRKSIVRQPDRYAPS